SSGSSVAPSYPELSREYHQARADERANNHAQAIGTQDADEISNVEHLQYEFGKIRDATNDFSETNKLEQGGFGVVYKGETFRRSRNSSEKIVDEFKASGYMAPEYVMHGQFSVKSDVFSFGVLVLETISGQRKNSFRNGEIIEDLVSSAWRNWRDGTITNLIDPVLKGNIGIPGDILKCIHIGLLCVQENATDRPTMTLVVLMLNNFSKDEELAKFRVRGLDHCFLLDELFLDVAANGARAWALLVPKVVNEVDKKLQSSSSGPDTRNGSLQLLLCTLCCTDVYFMSVAFNALSSQLVPVGLPDRLHSAGGNTLLMITRLMASWLIQE
ncbi:hypothetical protein RD792_000121, partial [Penstemon davidsonii]